MYKRQQSLWQILPLGPTGYGDSPYQSFSTFAGNPYYISLDALIEDGLLTEEECEAADYGDNPDYINYEKIYNTRFALLRKAFAGADVDQVVIPYPHSLQYGNGNSCRLHDREYNLKIRCV